MGTIKDVRWKSSFFKNPSKSLSLGSVELDWKFVLGLGLGLGGAHESWEFFHQQKIPVYLIIKFFIRTYLFGTLYGNNDCFGFTWILSWDILNIQWSQFSTHKRQCFKKYI